MLANVIRGFAQTYPRLSLRSVPSLHVTGMLGPVAAAACRKMSSSTMPCNSALVVTQRSLSLPPAAITAVSQKQSSLHTSRAISGRKARFLPSTKLQSSALIPYQTPIKHSPVTWNETMQYRGFMRGSSGGNARGIMGAVASAGILLAGKTKYLLAALKLGKFTTLISMGVSSAAYAFVFGWPYAIGMVGMMFVHESGHALEMRRQGLEISPMVFIPFMGAAVMMKDIPMNAIQDAKISLAGPVVGSAGALAVSIAGGMLESQMLLAVADFGFMINLFNLAPIGMLDGGRVMEALSPALMVAGLGIGGAMAYSGVIASPIFYIVLLFGAFSTVSRLWSGSSMPPSYHMVPIQAKVAIFLFYLGLIGVLFYLHDWNKKKLRSPKQLGYRGKMSEWIEETPNTEFASEKGYFIKDDE